jgi:hypothetical protein
MTTLDHRQRNLQKELAVCLNLEDDNSMHQLWKFVPVLKKLKRRHDEVD